MLKGCSPRAHDLNNTELLNAMTISRILILVKIVYAVEYQTA